MEKLKAGIFDGCELGEFNPIELSAWLALKSDIINFLGDHKISEYQKMVDELMENFRKLGAHMSVKMQFLRFHLDYFPENCGNFSEKQDEHFHQDLRGMEGRYEGR